MRKRMECVVIKPTDSHGLVMRKSALYIGCVVIKPTYVLALVGHCSWFYRF